MRSESNMKQSELRDLEILMQQKNGFQRFTVSFIVLMLSFSYNYKVYVYAQKRRTQSWKKNWFTKPLLKQITTLTTLRNIFVELNFLICLKNSYLVRFSYFFYNNSIPFHHELKTKQVSYVVQLKTIHYATIIFHIYFLNKIWTDLFGFEFMMKWDRIIIKETWKLYEVSAFI